MCNTRALHIFDAVIMGREVSNKLNSDRFQNVRKRLLLQLKFIINIPNMHLLSSTLDKLIGS